MSDKLLSSLRSLPRLLVFTLACSLVTVAASSYTIYRNYQTRQKLRAIQETLDRLDRDLTHLSR